MDAMLQSLQSGDSKLKVSLTVLHNAADKTMYT